MADPRDVLITGLGLVSSLAEGTAQHWDALAGGGSAAVTGSNLTPVVDAATYAPYPIHPLIELDYKKQIPRKGDQRQMGPWQRSGTYAAGMALEDAGLITEPELLKRTHLLIAAGNGERDIQADSTILAALEAAERAASKGVGNDGGGADDPSALINELLPRELRPTLYLAQQSQLLAGNISLIHKATASSRTFKGEEIAGASAAQTACDRIKHGDGDIYLIGGAYNAARKDMLLIWELGNKLWHGEFAPFWDRQLAGGGMVTGSGAAFLVLESRAHARARNAKVYGQLSGVITGRCARAPGQSLASGRRLFTELDDKLKPGSLAVLSGASGVEPATSQEREFLDSLRDGGYEPAIRVYGAALGHMVEGHFPFGLALAALAVSQTKFYPPMGSSPATLAAEQSYQGQAQQILVTSWGHWRGEGLALVEAAP